MDITKIQGSDLEIEDVEKFTYLMTYSFPCQDLSVAGKGKGMAKGDGTRSGLLWEVERLLNEVDNLPQVLVMENVPQVHGKKNIQDFEKWIQFLENKGYSNYWQDLNAKNYGVAQNRNRCFMVSILGNFKYEFPEPIELTKKMKDYLEDEVEEKYYIKNEKSDKLIRQLIDNGTLENTMPTDRQTDRQAVRTVVTEQSIIPDNEISQTASKQDMTAESQIKVKTEPWLLNNENIGRKTDTATCLLARDYKGYGKMQLGNGVVEQWRKS